MTKGFPDCHKLIYDSNDDKMIKLNIEKNIPMCGIIYFH